MNNLFYDLYAHVLAYLKHKYPQLHAVAYDTPNDQLLHTPIYAKVRLPIPNHLNIYVEGPFWDSVVLPIDIISHPALLEDALQPVHYAQKICQSLHGYAPSTRHCVSPLLLCAKDPWVSDCTDRHKNKITLNFETMLDFSAPTPTAF